MDDLVELVQETFAERKRIHFIYSEPVDAPILGAHFKQLKTDKLEGSGLNHAGQLAAASGLYAIMVVSYTKLLVPKKLDCEKVLSFLEEEGLDQDFTSDMCFTDYAGMQKAMLCLMTILKRHPASIHNVDFGSMVFASCHKGERLMSAFFALEPLPDDRPYS